jgi:hypothetical protein
VALAGRPRRDGHEAGLVDRARRAQPRGAPDPRAPQPRPRAPCFARADGARQLRDRARRNAGAPGLPRVRDDEPGGVRRSLRALAGVPGPLAGLPLRGAADRGRIPRSPCCATSSTGSSRT